MVCNYGTVCWRLKAAIHRPGTFTQRMGASREIIVVAAPAEDDAEDSEHIVVERLWENQLQYLISISGRTFCIGGKVPVTFTLMPLDKVKIHRIAVYLEGMCFATHWNGSLNLYPQKRPIITPSSNELRVWILHPE
jgi:hypothetical protein